MEQKKERLIYLDVIRTLAVICVFVVHFTRQLEYAGISYNGYKILPDTLFDVYLGGYGVSLFFAVSGAALMYNYGGKCELKNFYKKRFWGIYPMFWMAFGIVFLYRFYMEKSFTFACEKWTILLTITGMDGYLSFFFHDFYILGEWFLGCIILLYLIFPLVRKGVLEKPKLTAVLILGVYVLCILVTGGHYIDGKMPLECLFLVRLPEFAAGMYFVQYFKKIKVQAALIAAAVLVVFGVVDFSGWYPTVVTSIVGIASFVVITFVSPYIDCKVVRSFTGTLGKYCYAVFLAHHVVIMGIVNSFMGAVPEEGLRVSEVWLLFLCCVGVTIVLAGLLYRLNTSVCRTIKGFLHPLTVVK